MTSPEPFRGTGRASARWPLVTALVPDPDTWRVSGAGRALVARRRPDGRIAWGSLSFDLKRPASLLLFGNPAMDEGCFEEILEALVRIEDAPLLVGGSDRLASRFAYGAIAFARAADPTADGVDASLLGVFARPHETGNDLRRAFDGEDGVCSPALLERCAREAAADLADGHSLAVHVAMGFEVVRRTELLAALEADPDFVREDRDAYGWVPARGDRQRLGIVTLVRDGLLEAETVSLELGGRLCGRLKRLARGGVALVRIAHGSLGGD